MYWGLCWGSWKWILFSSPSNPVCNRPPNEQYKDQASHGPSLMLLIPAHSRWYRPISSLWLLLYCKTITFSALPWPDWVFRCFCQADILHLSESWGIRRRLRQALLLPQHFHRSCSSTFSIWIEEHNALVSLCRPSLSFCVLFACFRCSQWSLGLFGRSLIPKVYRFS